MSDFLTTEQFVKRAKQRHGNKYDYRLVSYKNSRTKVKIICREHGQFYQGALVHLNGAGCKHCADIERGKKRREQAAATVEARARAVHGDKFDYSRVKYERASMKVEIVCPDHGLG